MSDMTDVKETRDVLLQALADLFDLGGDLAHLGLHAAMEKMGQPLDALMDALNFTPAEVADEAERRGVRPFWER
jgi:hypothetical protein